MTAICDPPFKNQYRELLSDSTEIYNCKSVGECELPLIDLSGLWSEDREERMTCVGEIAKASSEWGFFQVLNHGIGLELLGEMRGRAEEFVSVAI